MFSFKKAIAVVFAMATAFADPVMASASCNHDVGSDRIWSLDVGAESQVLKVPESWIDSYTEGSSLDLDIPLLINGRFACMDIELSARYRRGDVNEPFDRTRPSIADIQDWYLEKGLPDRVREGSIWFTSQRINNDAFDDYKTMFGMAWVGEYADVGFFGPIAQHRSEGVLCSAGHTGKRSGDDSCRLAIELGDIIAYGPTGDAVNYDEAALKGGAAFNEISLWHNELVATLSRLVVAGDTRGRLSGRRIREPLSGDLAVRSLDGVLVSMPQEYLSYYGSNREGGWKARHMGALFEYSTIDGTIKPYIGTRWDNTSGPDWLLVEVHISVKSETTTGESEAGKKEFECGTFRLENKIPDYVAQCYGELKPVNGLHVELTVNDVFVTTDGVPRTENMVEVSALDKKQLVTDARAFLNKILVVEEIKLDTSVQ